MADASPNDFVYFDPPYVPLSPTSSFTAYAQRRFGPDEQRLLAAVLRSLGKRGVPALLSNSSCSSTRALYEGPPSDEILVPRRSTRSPLAAAQLLSSW